MTLSATLFAFMNLFAKVASSTAGWATVASVRGLVGALVAFTVARMRNESLAGNDKRALFFRSVVGTGAMMACFYALSSRTLGLGDTTTLLNLMPVFLAVLAPIFLRERTAPIVALAIAVALAGVVLLVRPTFLFGAHDGPAPDARGPSAAATAAFAVLSAFLSSNAMILIRRIGQKEHAETIAFHFSMFSGVVLGLVALFDLRVPSLRDAGAMLGAGLCAGFAQLAMTRAYMLDNAARVGAVSYVSVVVSAMLGAVALGERPPLVAIAGMALVIVGGVMVSLAKERYSPPLA